MANTLPVTSPTIKKGKKKLFLRKRNFEEWGGSEEAIIGADSR